MAITSVNNSVCLQTIVDMYGIDPLKFNCIDPLCITYVENGCEAYWTQHFERGNLISREELALELYRAELEVAAYLDQFPFPTYVCDEHVELEYCYRNNNFMGVNLQDYIFDTRWNCVQEFGQFDNVILGTGAITYIDREDDGYFESAEISFDYSAVTDSFDIDELTLLFQGYDDYNNVICPIIKRVDDDVAKVVTFTVDSWNLVNPELYIYRKFVDYTAPDACDLANYVTEVNVCIKQKSCRPDGWLVFDDSQNCVGNNCEEVKFPFCARIVNKRLGHFKISVGTVDDEGCFVQKEDGGMGCFSDCFYQAPKRIEINYLSSCNNCLKTKKDLSFCNLLERAIIYIALARLPRVLCECGCNTIFLEELKYDTSIRYVDNDARFNFPSDLIRNNPFGTKIGEIEGYKILRELKDKIC